MRTSCSQVYQRIKLPLLARSAPMVTTLHRQWPGKLRRTLGDAEQVAFICAGNIARSVYAEHRLRSLCPHLQVAVGSAGLWAHPGAAADPEAVAVGRERNIDLSRHRSRQLDKESITAGTVLFVMEPFHLARLSALIPHSPATAFLLSSVSWGRVAIRDPRGNCRETYRRIFDRIDQCLERLGPMLTGDPAHIHRETS